MRDRLWRIAAAAFVLGRMRGSTLGTPEKKQRILDALSLHPSKSRACRSAKVPRRTFYNWVREDAEFRTQVDVAQHEGIDAVEDALLQDALNHDTTAAIFTLKSWRPERYRETQQHEHKHSHQHRHYDLSMFTADEQLQIAELAAKYAQSQDSG